MNYLYKTLAIVLTSFSMALAIEAFAGSVEDARRYMVRGKIAIEEAKTVADYKLAVKEFKKATELDPNNKVAWFNLGVAQKKAELFGDAKHSLEKYLSLAPNAPDASEVRNMVYELEYRQEKQTNKLKQMDGTWVASSDICGSTRSRGGFYLKLNTAYRSAEITTCQPVRWVTHGSGKSAYWDWKCPKSVPIQIVGDKIKLEFTRQLYSTNEYNPGWREWVEKMTLELNTRSEIQGICGGGQRTKFTLRKK